ncbi:MAG: hypothetical protein IJP29_05600 [Lachnospiraceae bacterium]|nr:hypothetical protein [Lachnospiraceae bacterium]
MYYELKKGRIGFVAYEELKNDYVMYGFPEHTVEECLGNLYNFRSDIHVSDDLIFVVLDIIYLRDVFGEKDRIALFLQPELCLIVSVKDENERIRNIFETVVKRYDTQAQGLKSTMPEGFLYHFLDKLIVEDRKILENMEFHMSLLEDQMLSERINPSFINDILRWKKELMYIWNYYEQLIDIGEVLKDNENHMFVREGVRRFATFTDRVRRLSDNVRHLKEYTVQLRETHDAMLDYTLNNTMKFFTVITTIFLPLTLIVGWYGMNFQYMPELHWRYGYLGVFIFSVLVVTFTVISFRKYRLL